MNFPIFFSQKCRKGGMLPCESLHTYETCWLIAASELKKCCKSVLTDSETQRFTSTTEACQKLFLWKWDSIVAKSCMALQVRWFLKNNYFIIERYVSFVKARESFFDGRRSTTSIRLRTTPLAIAAVGHSQGLSILDSWTNKYSTRNFC